MLLLCGGALAAGFEYLKYFAKTPTVPRAESLTLTIARGMGLSQTATHLFKHGLITHPVPFKVLVRLRREQAHIKAGEYELSGTMSPGQILDILCRGKVKRHRITIPEGLTMAEISQRINQSGLGERPDFMPLARNADFCKELGITAEHLEGYLFPETYFFEKSASAAVIIRTMVNRFHEIFQADWKQRAKEMGLSVHQVVTLAAIIEKETGAAKERPLIASVFHNRLKKKMRLQSDPTVIYGIADFNGNLTRKDLKTPTPYNTYQIAGLPPGPIANPGRQALEATLYPTKSNFLYFVSKKDGTHHFSKTLKAHNRAVRKYQLRR